MNVYLFLSYIYLAMYERFPVALKRTYWQKVAHHVSVISFHCIGTAMTACTWLNQSKLLIYGCNVAKQDAIMARQSHNVQHG